jgi:hypothetical protein
MPCVSLRLDLDLAPNFQEVGRRKIEQIDRSNRGCGTSRRKAVTATAAAIRPACHARLRRVRRGRQQCRDRGGSRGLLPAEEECADASSCPLCVAHQLTAPMVVGPVGLWVTRRVVHKSTGGCGSGSRSQFGVIVQISVLVVIGEARGPWKIANRPSGYSCTHTMARTKCGRSGLGGICRVSPRHLTVLPLPTLRSSWRHRRAPPLTDRRYYGKYINAELGCDDGGGLRLLRRLSKHSRGGLLRHSRPRNSNFLPPFPRGGFASRPFRRSRGIYYEGSDPLPISTRPAGLSAYSALPSRHSDINHASVAGRFVPRLSACGCFQASP